MVLLHQHRLVVAPEREPVARERAAAAAAAGNERHWVAARRNGLQAAAVPERSGNSGTFGTGPDSDGIGATLWIGGDRSEAHVRAPGHDSGVQTLPVASWS